MSRVCPAVSEREDGVKAIVYDEYVAPDDVLELQEINKPVIGDGEVLVRIRAASTNPYDWHMLRGLPYPMRQGKGCHRRG